MIKASVIGWPILHSRSPLIHNYWLEQHGIAGIYTKQPVAPDELQSFIETLRTGETVGTNVTLPHKEAALRFIDNVDDRVRRIGALNTIWRDGTKLHATSTDGPGFLANIQHIQPRMKIAAAHVTIFGAGGSTRAIVDELLRSDVGRISIHNRTLSRAQSLAHHFGPKVHALEHRTLNAALAHTNLLINTTSAGMTGANEIEMPWNQLQPDAVVADIVYTPLVTPFLDAALARGHSIVPGLGMLLHQAVGGFEKWFGVRPEVTQDLYDLVARDIDPEYRP